MRPKFDIIFMPHKDYHSCTMFEIAKLLEDKNISTAFLEPTERHANSHAIDVLEGKDVYWIKNDDFTSVERSPIAVVTMNDWDQSASHLLTHCKQMGIEVVGLQEGTTDFLRNNWVNEGYNDPSRLPYSKCDFLLLASEFDASYFPKKEHVVIGMDRVEPLFKESVVFPSTPVVLINLNFSYKVCLEFARDWLTTVTEACEKQGLEYVISVHPQDETDLSDFEDKVDNAPLHALIKKTSLFVSRFSNAIYEALALGKPVVYFNPHNEQSAYFNKPEGAFSVARTPDELGKAIAFEIGQRNIRDRAKTYFQSHLSLSEEKKSSERSAEALFNLVNKKRTIANNHIPKIFNNPDISIIIPVYNVGQYIDRCLDSLLGQTFGNIEIIVVDDASTDATLAIATCYSQFDKRIHIKHLRTHSGQSRARNIGMMMAKGHAIMFVDGDDWLHVDACRIAYDTLVSRGDDIVLFDYLLYVRPFATVGNQFDFEKINQSDFDRSELLRICSACTKIYASSFLNRIDAYFPEGTIFEDWFWTIQWATQAATISAIAEPLYFYRRNRPDSTTSGHFPETEIMRAIIKNIAMSKRYLDVHGGSYGPLATLINKADARIRNDKKNVDGVERKVGYCMLKRFLKSLFPTELPGGVTSKSILGLYLNP